MPADLDTLMEKLRRLPAEHVREVEDFVDFLDHRRLRAAAQAAVERMQRAAQEHGLSKMTDAEIEAEIAAARRSLRGQ